MSGKVILPHNHNAGDSRQLKEAIPSPETIATVAEALKQLGDPTRLRIFWLLCHTEECVADIAEYMDMSSPAVSHHLRSLRDTGLIVSRREGKEVFYCASDSDVAQMLHHMIEEAVSITCPEEAELLSDCRADQIALIHEVHEYLVSHLEEKVTIEALSRQFHMNTTTLKSVFKSVYGDSLAAHIKEHRLEHAAELLTGTGLTIAEIGRRVGYDSQSKFSTAFKGRFGLLPKEYRKIATRD